MHPDAPRSLTDVDSDLEQAQADRVELGACIWVTFALRMLAIWHDIRLPL